ncbi:MAG: glycosyltransferase [Planctomycetota bacterium]
MRAPTGQPDSHASEPTARLQIAAVTPCFNAPGDFAHVTGDLLAIADEIAREGVDLRIVAVDNASDPALAPSRTDPRLQVLRLPTNRGGSGGYNAGLAHALLVHQPAPEWLWLVDSDARVTTDTLRAMIRRIEPDAVVVGAAIAWPTVDDIFERGGVVDARTGSLRGVAPGEASAMLDYAAACCLLVRAEAARRVGLMPDVFLNGDDAAWCLRLIRATSQRVVVADDAVAVHPRFDQAKGWQRYYTARNAFLPIEAKGARPRRARAARAWREACRAAGQILIGRDEIAELHLKGLADALGGRWPALAPAELPTPEARPLDQLARDLETLTRDGARRYGVDPTLHADDVRAIEAALAHAGLERTPTPPSGAPLAALKRLAWGPGADLVVASPKGRPAAWMGGRHALVPLGDRYELHRLSGAGAPERGVQTLLHGALMAIRAAVRAPRVAPNAVPRLERRYDASLEPIEPAPLSLSIIVLSYNRRDALAHTLERLTGDPATAQAEIIVVDNASADDTLGMLADRFPALDVLALETNIGVDAFNRGVDRASGDVVLILDDDAWPEPDAIEGAMRELAADPSLAAITLHPKHPSTGKSEWPFAHAAGSWSRDWPVMGCGNLVRRAAWIALGGYERDFFLYRNDADLALKALAANLGVGFDPAWVVWHDSPAAKRKSARWFQGATRNWVWMTRRHGRGFGGVIASLAGWLWAHKLAGPRLGDHARVFRGALAGWLSSPPPLPPTASPSGRDVRTLLTLLTRYRSSAASTSDSIDRHSP